MREVKACMKSESVNSSGFSTAPSIFNLYVSASNASIEASYVFKHLQKSIRCMEKKLTVIATVNELVRRVSKLHK